MNGKTEVQFVPMSQMYAFAMARAMPQNAAKDDAEICEFINLKKQTLNNWRNDYNPYFDEWLENFILTHTNKKLLKQMLEAVGIKKALEGEFNFWKSLALREKIITPEAMNLNVIPVDLKNYDEWNESEIASQRQALLDSLRPALDQGGFGVDDAAQEAGAQGSSHGANPVQK